MPFELVNVSTVPASPDAVFALIVDLSRWSLFTGWGPIPGIVEATLQGPVALGARIRVRNTDGSVHHEVVTALEPGRRYAVRMEVERPASFVLQGLEETVDLEPVAGGTRMVRRFFVAPASFVTAPLAWLVARVFLARAVRAHDAAVVAALTRPT